MPSTIPSAPRNGLDPPAIPASVAEIQGLYGPFTFSEKLLQKIWLRQDFDVSAAFTFDGRKVEVVDQGNWNLQAGPDFKNARLRIDGMYVEGDVELHLYAEDWAAHGHGSDPAYNNVVLHVVLFVPAGTASPSRTEKGKKLPVLALLPLLRHDLEDYAADEAVEGMTGRPNPEALAELLAKDLDSRMQVLREMSARRWRRKVHFARVRVDRVGWDNACHQTALEILGYRFNRIPMLKLATRLPIERWRQLTESEIICEFRQGFDGWNLQGVRPANQPLLRLKQYGLWIHNRPHWPAALHGAHKLWNWTSIIETGGGKSQHKLALLRLREMFARAVVSDAITGSRLDTLVCDGFLPLLSATAGGSQYESAWYHWAPGDLPSRLAKSLRILGAGNRSRPVHQGMAQGVLEWLSVHPLKGDDTKI